MIDSIFLIDRDREKHRKAPLFSEREKYLTHLFEIGTRRERVRNVATMLLHIVRLLQLDSYRPVGMDEIVKASKRWTADSNACRHHKLHMASPYTFQVAATNWFRFQGSLIPATKPTTLFDNLLSEFLDAMRSEHGLAVDTLRSYQSRVFSFLNWLQLHRCEFSTVRAPDIKEYLEEKQSVKWSRNSVAAHCRALRTFFGFAEQKRWCPIGIRDSILSPRVPRIAENLSVPPWKDVRRVIASISGVKAADLRAKAMFLLLAIYGFRSAEVRGLMLEDIDWRRGSITVHRAKRGKTQQFTLQNEVGEAIALYLEKARPKCACRSLFVTLNPPFRPVLGSSMGTIINPRAMKLGLAPALFGPHMLRRACATQLLRTGSSLKDIADFLGHSNLRSVSSYARLDSASLRTVAKFSLRGVL